MREYSIVPEFRFCKAFPLGAICFQILTFVFVILGYYFAAISYIAAGISQVCACYYLLLLLTNRNYRLQITASSIAVRDLFRKERSYTTGTIRWKIKRIPWYNTYYVLLYSIPKVPIAILKPHWKNVSRILQLPHYGPLDNREREYVQFLKSVGLKY